jgi:hypothetical protein
MKLKLSDSIYSKMGGLDVKNGRLVNNRPDGMTGIAQVAMAKSEMKRIKKVQMIADGVALGDMMSEG